MDVNERGDQPLVVTSGQEQPVSRLGGWGKTLWRLRRGIGLLFLVVAGLVAWLAFPQPDPALWPPAVRDDRNVVYICLNGFHSFLTFPDYQLGFFQEWHMGAETWYLNGAFPWHLRVSALFRPVSATIRFGLFPFTSWERRSLPEAKVYKFWLTPSGRERLVAFLHRQRGKMLEQKTGFTYFASTRNWSPLGNCNGFIGGDLQAAGLPVRESVSLEGLTMQWQLDRCRRYQQAWLDRLAAVAASP